MERKLLMYSKLILIYSLSVFYAWVYCAWFALFVVKQPSWIFWKVKKRFYPECLNSVGEHKCIQLNNVKLHYVQAGDSSGSKPLMLFVHGFPEFWYSWRHQMKAFADDYWVVAVDLRGFGYSEKPPLKSDYHMSHVIEDIRELMIALGREKAILVGHDWGGILCWNFIDLYPEMVDKYIIINAPYIHSWIEVTSRNVRQFLASWYCFFFQVPYLPELAMRIYDCRIFNSVLEESCEDGALTMEDLDAYKYVFSKKDAMKYPLNYYRANCGIVTLKDNHPNRMPPGLFLFSDKDDYLVTDFVRMAKKHVTNLQTHILQDCHHFVQQTKPTVVNNAMKNFLQNSLKE